ncbi:MAG: twin-arginine translocation signal domain-containing protein [Acidobacteria bacterium]|nr:twin-arginine translocation signal domain-containing protein [Acidobacteriota bacterium]
MQRRDFLKAASAGALWAGCGGSSPEGPAAARKGAVVGEPRAAAAGLAMLEIGGNAVDAIVAAALTAGVTAVQMCGSGGYGGHMTLAFADSGKVTSIDFNTLSPAALTEDRFAPNADGTVPGQINQFGWLASGVPGTLAGMDLALREFGTKSFAQAVAPAIRHAQEGFPVDAALARSIASAKEQLLADPAAAALLCPNGKPLAEGDHYENPDLGAMLDELAKAGSTEPFYKGDIAEKIVAAFQSNGGIVTMEDFAAYEAKVVEPLKMQWRGDELFTAPLTAGGLTIFEALSILDAAGYPAMKAPLEQTHAWLEALRICWKDRLELFGDPQKSEDPTERLLSKAYAEESAARVRKAVEGGKPLDIEIDYLEQVGTIHLSAADGAGNMAALTLTHGGGFGARVAVPGLGLLLGHGMSRFDPRPGHPNSPGPRKRPLHNMCPTIVRRDGKPTLAVGARGGRRIPNCVLSVLLDYSREGSSVQQAVAAPRMHVEGGLAVGLDEPWEQAARDRLTEIGYTVSKASVAVASAVGLDPASGEWATAER